MAWEEIESADDPRVLPYRALLRSKAARRSGLFIAESAWVVERLLASKYAVQSILVSRRFAEEWARRAPQTLPVLVCDEGLLHEIAGFRFHRGVMACAARQANPSLAQLASDWPERATILICPQIADQENLGGILRSAAAFAVDAVLVGGRSVDPFARRVLRVSMGAHFRTVVLDVDSLETYLDPLRTQYGFQFVATTLEDQAVPLARARRPDRLALLLGHEGYGLEDRWLAQCDQRVTIPMPGKTDSLNVVVAASICLYHYSQQ